MRIVQFIPLCLNIMVNFEKFSLLYFILFFPFAFFLKHNLPGIFSIKIYTKDKQEDIQLKGSGKPRGIVFKVLY